MRLLYNRVKSVSLVLSIDLNKLRLSMEHIRGREFIAKVRSFIVKATVTGTVVLYFIQGMQRAGNSF